MTVGFVLVSCDAGFEKDIVKKLLSFNEVINANPILGIYDIVVEIKYTFQKFRELISWKFHKLQRIRSIISLMGKP